MGNGTTGDAEICKRAYGTMMEENQDKACSAWMAGYFSWSDDAPETEITAAKEGFDTGVSWALRTQEKSIIDYLERRIERLEEDCPSIRDDHPDSFERQLKVLDAKYTRSYTIHYAAKAELRATIRQIKAGKHVEPEKKKSK